MAKLKPVAPAALDLKLGPLNLGAGGPLKLGLGRNLLAKPGAADMPDGVSLVALDYPDELMVDGGDGTGTFEEEVTEAIGETLGRMHEIRKHAAERLAANTGTEYYAVVVFLDEQQRDAFLAATGWDRFAGGGRFVNGVALAAEMGVELPPSAFQPLDFKKG